MAKQADSKEIQFEEAFQKLEATVQALETGNLTLSKATALYEEGMRLAKICSQRLDAAELKISELQTAFASASGQEVIVEEVKEVELVDEDEDA